MYRSYASCPVFWHRLDSMLLFVTCTLFLEIIVRSNWIELNWIFFFLLINSTLRTILVRQSCERRKNELLRTTLTRHTIILNNIPKYDGLVCRKVLNRALNYRRFFLCRRFVFVWISHVYRVSLTENRVNTRRLAAERNMLRTTAGGQKPKYGI